MNRPLLLSICVGCCLAAAPADAQSLGCTRGNPEFGQLVLNQPGLVTVMRKNVPHRLGTNAMICLGDRILSSTNSGFVRPKQGEVKLLERGRDLLIPRLQTIVGWLWDTFIRRQLLDEKIPAGAGALGGQEPGFLLPSIADGKARIGEQHRTVIVPVAWLDNTQRVELWGPDARTPLVADVTARQGRAVFTGVRLHAGQRWRLYIDGLRRLPGGFVVESFDWRGEIDREMGRLRLGQRDATMAYACLDPYRNAFEAYQLVRSSEDRARLVMWQRPTDDVTCATPIEE